MNKIGCAVLGAGYWGPNLARNISNHEACDLRWVCDLDVERAERLASRTAGAAATDDLDRVLADPAVAAVAIATPASTHAEVAVRSLRAGKHVLIEKPIAASVAEAEEMLRVAGDEQLVLMCDHTYCYSPAVQHIRSVIESGEIGDVLFVDSVRINLGLVQPDVNVLWDLAPHDLSILDDVLPIERSVVGVAATGFDPIGAGQQCVGHLSLDLAGGSSAHIHVNWLSPTKVRNMIIGGSRKTLVWDDLNPVQRISMFDRGVELAAEASEEIRHRSQISYRVGDIMSPALRDVEALAGVIDELVAGVRGDRIPRTDGFAGLRVLQVLEASDTSLDTGGVRVPVSMARRSN